MFTDTLLSRFYLNPRRHFRLCFAMTEDVVPSPRLNYDILREIVSHAPTSRTCAALMLTSRFFNYEAAVVLLQLHPEIHFYRETIPQFLSRHDFYRCRHVRQFDLWTKVYEASQETMRALCQCLPHMDHLEVFRLLDGEFTFRTFPELGPILADLTSLRYLHIHHVGVLTCAFLKTVQAPLSTLYLDWETESEMGTGKQPYHRELDVDQWPCHHPVAFLAKWAPTLEKVSSRMWITGPDPPASAHVYPKMRSLSYFADYPLVLPYMRAFPNLTHLEVVRDLDEDFTENMRAAHMPPLDAHRALNVQSQIENVDIWEQLEEVTGPVVDLYVLGLTCRICHLHVDDELSRVVHLEMFAAIVSSAQPRHLKIQGRDGMLDHPTLAITAMLRGNVLSGLESLVLDIDLMDGSPRNATIAATLVRPLLTCPCAMARAHRELSGGLRVGTGQGAPPSSQASCDLPHGRIWQIHATDKGG